MHRRALAALVLWVGFPSAVPAQSELVFLQSAKVDGVGSFPTYLSIAGPLVVADGVVYERGVDSVLTPVPVVGVAGCGADPVSDVVTAITPQYLVYGFPYDDGPAGLDQGTVCVFARDASGYAYRATLVAPDIGAKSLFGDSLAIEGSTIVVGAPSIDESPFAPRAGSVYVYEADGAGFPLRAKLVPDDSSPGDRFGTGVALDAQRVIVGADRGGGAYVYDRTPAGLVFDAKLPSGNVNDVDIEGTTAAVAGVLFIGQHQAQTPDAYVYERGASGWDLAATLQPQSSFVLSGGTSVELSDGTLLAGAPGGTPGTPFSGHVAVFRRIGDQWLKRGSLRPNPVLAGSRFGAALALDGDHAASVSSCDGTHCAAPPVLHDFTGVPLDDDLLLSDTLRAAAGGAGDGAGDAIAFANGLLVVGAPNGGDGGATGEVYVFAFDAGAASARPRAKSTRLVATLRTSGGQVGDKFGSAVAITPDGATIAVGMPGASSGQGGVAVFRKPAAGWVDTDVTADSLPPPTIPNAVVAAFGSAIAISASGAIAVGAPGSDIGDKFNAGAAATYAPLAGDYPSTPTQVFVPDVPQANAAYGDEVDLTDELLTIAAPNQDLPGPLPDTGEVYAFSKLPTADQYTAEATLTTPGGGTVGDKFGRGISVRTDAGGSTVVVGAPGIDDGGDQDEGRAWVYAESGGTLLPVAQLRTGGAAFDRAGSAIEISATHVVIGAGEADRDGETDSGAAFVFRAPSGGWVEAAAAHARLSGKRGLGVVDRSPDGELRPADLQAMQFFGAAVSLGAGSAFVSAPARDVRLASGAVQPDQGAVDVFSFDEILADGFE